jgi:hypothetical protein
MLDIMERFNVGDDVTEDLGRLLEHEDYQIELERYKNHLARIGFTKEDYIEYFINIRNTSVNTISSKGLKYRVNDLLYIIDNVDYYRGVYNRIEKFDESYVLNALEKTRLGLPDDIKLNDIRIIFSIGLGVSGGWIYKNYTHFDLKVVIDKKTEQGLLNTIAHECHHMGYNKMFEGILENELKEPMDSTLMFYLSGEGTAIKYCNNFEGVLTNKIYEDEEISINRISYDYYRSNFDDIYHIFKLDIEALRTGKIKDIKEFEDLFMNHYFYRDVEIDGKLNENYLGQPVAYHFGADVWGIIHDTYGREKVFDLLRNPSQIFKYYNEALLKINRKDLCID